MKWLEITVYTQPESEEIISAVLMEAGAQGVRVEGAQAEPGPWDYLDAALEAPPFSVSAYFPQSEGEDALAFVERAISQIRDREPGLPLGSLEVRSSLVDESDWENAWKTYFKPLRISERFVVCPSWETYAPEDGEMVIDIDPGMAFGTGSHETTRLCVRLLEEYMEEGNLVVDAGCGSGILSIAAAMLGAGHVHALDCDPVAVGITVENAERNDCGGRISAARSDLLAALDGEAKADVVVANIVADVVIRLSDEARANMKRNGMLLCSGVIDTRLDDVKNALEVNGFRIIEVLKDGEWRAVAAKYKR